MLGRWVERYHAEKGVYPESWAEVESRFGPIKSRSGLDHLERFTFVPETVSVPYPPDGRIIFISREPFRPPVMREFPFFSGLGDRVYFAAVGQGDEVHLQHISPLRAAQFFEKAGVNLPAPSGLGLYRHERAHRSEVIVRWVGLVVLCGFMVRAVLRRRKARRGGDARVEG